MSASHNPDFEFMPQVEGGSSPDSGSGIPFSRQGVDEVRETMLAIAHTMNEYEHLLFENHDSGQADDWRVAIVRDRRRAQVIGATLDFVAPATDAYGKPIMWSRAVMEVADSEDDAAQVSVEFDFSNNGAALAVEVGANKLAKAEELEADHLLPGEDTYDKEAVIRGLTEEGFLMADVLDVVTASPVVVYRDSDGGYAVVSVWRYIMNQRALAILHEDQSLL